MRWHLSLPLLLVFMLATSTSLSDQAGDLGQVTLSMHATAAGHAHFTYQDCTTDDEVTVDVTERVQYRIAKIVNGALDLEVVSHQNSFSASGGGKSTGKLCTGTWTYQIKDHTPDTKIGVWVNLRMGKGGFVVLSSFIKDAELRTTEGSWGYAGSALWNLAWMATDKEEQGFLKQLQFSFKPYAKNISAHRSANYTYQDKTPWAPASAEVHVDFSLVTGADMPDLEVVITPPPGLRDWIPKGGKDDSTPGETLIFKGEVRQKGGKKDNRLHEVKFQLLSSAELGICNNYPRQPPNQLTPDLRILRKDTSPQFNEIKQKLIDDQNYSFQYSTEGQFKVGEKFKLAVGSFDYGAYGKLTVESEPKVSVRIEGYPRTTVKLPRDDNDNHIADKWEEENLPPNYSSDAKSDEDDLPRENKYKGDGFSLYEEYRGFMVKGKHQQTKPNEKDLFIYSNMPRKTEVGIKLFGIWTFIKVHEINKDEMDENQVMNFNSSYAHIVDQHAKSINVLDEEQYNKFNVKDNKLASKVSGGFTTLGGKVIRILNTGDLDSKVMHELGHSVWINHHGDGNYYADENKESMTKLGEEAKKLGISLEYLFIAVQNGENSGPDTCVMRYASAHFIERIVDGKRKFYPYGPPDGSNYKFCDSPRGTGVNDPEKTPNPPYPKCGDAFRGRGACPKQIHVSDSDKW